MFENEPRLIPFQGSVPQIEPGAWLAPGVVLTGAVHVCEAANLWFGVVARGDTEAIWIGPRCNIQDGVVLHTDEGAPLELAADVAVGHGAIVHGCSVEPEVMVGMGATVLSGARLGEGSVIGAGSVVREGTEIPAGALAVGVPARVVGKAREGTTRAICERYAARARKYQQELQEAENEPETRE
jgi:carbonic anhydrase/acetyltransferase-like protein (isoleucine patch superfamily)